jgi:hypothetical protein
MKCDDCFNLLEEYLDGEAAERDAAQVSAHLITCAVCAQEFEALTAEREVYARYDRELEISASTWNAIAARTVAESATDSPVRFKFGEWIAGLFATPRYGFAGALAVLILAITIGLVYLRTRTTNPPANQDNLASLSDRSPGVPAGNSSENTKPSDALETGVNAPNTGGRRPFETKIAQQSRPQPPRRIDQPDVLYTDAAYTDIEDKDTASHLDQAQNLLLSFRTIKYSDDDEQVDVSYEKTESRRLLNENIVLRRDAEMAGKFPAKSVLGSLEPFLIDIANLPDNATPNDVRQIKERMQKTEIVAELRSY